MTPPPYTLIAELTHRCPLRCAYCSNPLALVAGPAELSTSDWRDVLRQSTRLGIVQVHFTGGEPLGRRDLTELVAEASALGLYTNLITSGLPLDEQGFENLVRAGVDHVQLSIQSLDPTVAASIAGFDELPAKRRLAIWVRNAGLPLTMNVVLHRLNISETRAFIRFAESVGADKLELANAQYQGWARANRDALLPSRDQISAAERVAREESTRLSGRMEIVFVRPDLYRDRPKACMDGWARRFVVVAPDGTMLPCHSARELPGFEWQNVRDRPLREIWESPAFERFRGEGWMRDPCRTCPERSIDFGGCRCQAFALTGDASATDPACSLSPNHAVVLAARAGTHRNKPVRLRGSVP
jgi:pyrroloquinoline quinone biosynthesis protein E